MHDAVTLLMLGRSASYQWLDARLPMNPFDCHLESHHGINVGFTWESRLCNPQYMARLQLPSATHQHDRW